MGLVTPLALFLLGALSLPWLVHRMRQRDLPQVTLPTIALLQRAVAVTQRRRALEDLMLMLVRMLLIALLAVALASPFTWGPAIVGNGEPQSVVFVIDDSMSMQRSDHGSTLLQQALKSAASAINALPADSQVGVVFAGRPPRTEATLGSRDDALAALKGFKASAARGTELSAAISLADATLAAANHEQRAIVVLSDFVGDKPLDLAATSVEVSYETIGDGQAHENIAITGATARRDPEANGGFRIDVQVRAFHSAAHTVGVRVLAAKSEIIGDSILIERNAGHIELTLKADQVPDDHIVRIVIAPNDTLASDDARDVLLRDPNTLRVLLVNGDPHPTHSADELHFLSRALPLRAPGDVPLSIESTDSLGLERAPLDRFDVIWLANVEAPSAEAAARLQRFVDAGGGVVLSAGDRVDPAAYNARLSSLLPARIEGIAEASALEITEERGPDAFSANILGAEHAHASRRLITQTAGTPSLRFSDGSPALLHRSVGRGHVVLWTTSIDGDWSDLPFRPGFLAFTSSVLRALSPALSPTAIAEPGQAVALAIGSDAIEGVLIDPAGNRHSLNLKADVVAAAPQQTLSPGAYQVEITDDNGSTRLLPRSAFIVAPPIDESDISPVARPQTTATDAAEARHTRRAKQPFDAWLFACLAPLFLLEAMLRVQRRRASTTRAMPPRSA